MLENIWAALGAAMSAIATFVPKLLLFLVIFLIGWFIAKGLRKLTNTILERLHFDTAVERGGLGRMLSQSKYDASDVIAMVVYYAILLLTLQVAFGVFGPNAISDMITQIVAFLPQIIVAIVIVVVAAAIGAAVKDLISSVTGSLSYGHILATIAQVFIIALGVIAALNQVGVATTVTMPVLVAVLATVGGIMVVGVGGGLIRPMQQRWEGWLQRAESDTREARAHTQAYERGREDASATGRHAEATDPMGTQTQEMEQGQMR